MKDNISLEEYDALPIEEQDRFVAMVKRDGRWVLHHVCTKGVFTATKGLEFICGQTDEQVAYFKLQFVGFNHEEK